LNAWVESRGVTDLPGTTRDVVESPADCRWYPEYRVLDTAEFAKTADQVEKIGVDDRFIALKQLI